MMQGVIRIVICSSESLRMLTDPNGQMLATVFDRLAFR
jgi:hypothetical protein